MFFKKRRGRRNKNPANPRNIGFRSLSSAVAGLPISWILNIVAVIPITIWSIREGHSEYITATIIALPFFVASFWRMFLIDYLWFKYKVDINPVNMLERLYNRLDTLFFDYDEPRTSKKDKNEKLRRFDGSSGTKRT